MDDSIERIYGVELLFERQPEFPRDELFAALRSQCPKIESLGGEAESELLAFYHPDHVAQLEDGPIPAQLLVFPGDRESDHLSLEKAIEQSWLFPQARTTASSSKHKVLINDLMAGGIPYKERLQIFMDALEGIVSQWDCQAIHWRQSQQIGSRDQFLASRRDPEQHILQSGPLNARFFNVTDSEFEGEYIVDTMGLAVFNLPDIQCHFHSLDIDAVVHHLLNIAIYLYENGDVIESGNTVPGIADGQEWVCQHEDALAPPNRVVLDLNPGPAHAGGGRS